MKNATTYLPSFVLMIILWKILTVCLRWCVHCSCQLHLVVWTLSMLTLCTEPFFICISALKILKIKIVFLRIIRFKSFWNMQWNKLIGECSRTVKSDYQRPPYNKGVNFFLSQKTVMDTAVELFCQKIYFCLGKYVRKTNTSKRKRSYPQWITLDRSVVCVENSFGNQCAFIGHSYKTYCAISENNLPT